MKYKDFYKHLFSENRLISEKLVYHGTISDFVDKIKKSGKLISPSKGAKKVSGGYTTERRIIWFTPNVGLADMYAGGMESRNEYNLEKGIRADYGGIFGVELPEGLKLIDRHAPLDQEQIEKLNKTLIPAYKPLQPEDSISTAEWRIANQHDLKDILDVLGADGVVQGKGLQIGLAIEEIPINVFYAGKKK